MFKTMNISRLPLVILVSKNLKNIYDSNELLSILNCKSLWRILLLKKFM